MALQGQSHIKVTADINDAKVKLQQMQEQLRNAGKTADDVSSTIQGAFQKIGSTMAVGLSVAGLQQFTNQLIQTRGQFQQLEIAFGTMLGSTKADTLMKQLVQTASKTPFDMQGIAQGAKQLLAYGTAAEDVNNTIVKLGDIAAGLSLPLNDLVYLYGTTMAQGRMFTMDLRQMQGRGIPIAEEIAKIMNVSKEAVPDMVSAGKVTADIFDQAIKNMASEGGKFYNLMEKQSSSLTGQISNLEDAIDQMFNEIGKASEDFLSNGISAVSVLVDNYEYLGATIATIASQYGTQKALQAIISAGYDYEAKKLRELTTAKQDDLAEDLKKQVQNGVLSQQQAEEINSLRLILQEKVTIAKEEDRIASEALASAQKKHQLAQEDLFIAQEEIDTLNEKIFTAMQAGDAEELSNLQTEKASALETLHTAQTNLNTASEELNTASKNKNTASQQLNTAQTKLDTAVTSKNTTAKVILSNVMKGLRTQMIAFGKALMANPLFLIASAIAGIVAAVSTFIASIEDEEEQQARLNDEHQKFVETINEEQGKVRESVNILNDRTASIEKQAIAYREMQKYISDLQGMSLQEYQTLNPKVKQEIIDRYNAMQEERKEQELINLARENYLKINNEIFATEKEKKDAKKIYDDLVREKEEKEEVARIAKMSSEQQIKYYEQQVQALENQQNQVEYLSEEWTVLNNKIKNAKDTIESIKKPKIEVDTKATFDQITKDAQASIEAFDVNAIEMYNKLVKGEGIKRNDSGSIVGIDFKVLGEEAKGAAKYFNLLLQIDEQVQKYSEGKKGTKEYSDLFGSIDNAEKREKEITKLQKKAEDERVAYMRRRQEDKRQLIIDNKNAQLKAINEEEKEFNKQYGSTQESRSAFNNRRNTIKVNAQFDLDQLDKELKQWKDDFEKENEAIQLNIEVAGLQQELSLTDDINEKLKIQKEIRQKLFDQKLKEIELEKQQAIKEKFGEQELSKYLAGTSTNENVASLAKSYDARKYWTGKEMMFSNSAEQLAEELDRWEQFAQGVIDIETERVETIEAIQKGESHANIDSVNAWLNTKKANLMEELGVTDIPQELAEIVKLTTTTTLEGLQTQMAVVTQEIEALRLEGETELKQAQANNDTEGIEKANKKIALATKLGEKATKVFDKQGDELSTTNTKWEKVSKQMSETAMIISDVTNLIGSLEDAFDDLLSDGTKDAIQTMQTISGVATGLIQNQQLVALAAGESISAVEKASVILAIISAAVQVISAITNAIMKNFSANALMEDKLESYNQQLDALKEKHNEFDKTYIDSTGVDYWQRMAESASMYEEVLINIDEEIKQAIKRLKKAQEQGNNAKIISAYQDLKDLQDLRDSGQDLTQLGLAEQAVKEAEDNYNKMVDKYGANSEKAQNAKEMLTEQTEIYDSLLEEQAEKTSEVFKQMAQTDVTSFGESMAEALVSAFSQGLEGMNKAWKDTIEDMIKSMLQQRLALQLTDQFENAFGLLEGYTSSDSAGGAIITDDEMQSFLSNIESAKTGAMAIGEEYQKLFAELGLLDDTIDAESKGFQAMSQDTADELNGRFTALQISGAGIQMSAQGIATSVEDIARINIGIQGGVTELANNSSVTLQIAQNQLNELRIIADNTKMLEDTNKLLKEVKDNTARL